VGDTLRFIAERSRHAGPTLRGMQSRVGSTVQRACQFVCSETQSVFAELEELEGCVVFFLAGFVARFKVYLRGSSNPNDPLLRRQMLPVCSSLTFFLFENPQHMSVRSVRNGASGSIQVERQLPVSLQEDVYLVAGRPLRKSYPAAEEPLSQ